jgi:4-carboxymuconolactone decarboxylase
MSRLPYPEPATLSDRQRRVLDGAEGRVLNISRMAMHAPEGLWFAQRQLGRAVVFDTTIDDRLRELVILRVAHLSGSDYELFHHLNVAKALGVTSVQGEAMRTGDFSGLTDAEAALGAFATEVIRDVSPSDATLARARDHFPLEQLFEIVVLCGSYMMTARMAALGGIEPDAIAVVNLRKERK